MSGTKTVRLNDMAHDKLVAMSEDTQFPLNVLISKAVMLLAELYETNRTKVLDIPTE